MDYCTQKQIGRWYWLQSMDGMCSPQFHPHSSQTTPHSALSVASEYLPRENKLTQGTEWNCTKPGITNKLKVYFVQDESFDGNHLEIIFNYGTSLPNSEVINNMVNLPNKIWQVCFGGQVGNAAANIWKKLAKETLQSSYWESRWRFQS
jgi:hypothetical protein